MVISMVMDFQLSKKDDGGDDSNTNDDNDGDRG